MNEQLLSAFDTRPNKVPGRFNQKVVERQSKTAKRGWKSNKRDDSPRVAGAAKLKLRGYRIVSHTRRRKETEAD